MSRYESRMDLACKIDWEGGIFDSLDYGIRAGDMPEGDDELIEAWTALDVAYKVVAEAADRVSKLLP